MKRIACGLVAGALLISCGTEEDESDAKADGSCSIVDKFNIDGDTDMTFKMCMEVSNVGDDDLQEFKTDCENGAITDGEHTYVASACESGATSECRYTGGGSGSAKILVFDASWNHIVKDVCGDDGSGEYTELEAMVPISRSISITVEEEVVQCTQLSDMLPAMADILEELFKAQGEDAIAISEDACSQDNVIASCENIDESEVKWTEDIYYYDTSGDEETECASDGGTFSSSESASLVSLRQKIDRYLGQ